MNSVSTSKHFCYALIHHRDIILDILMFKPIYDLSWLFWMQVNSIIYYPFKNSLEVSFPFCNADMKTPYTQILFAISRNENVANFSSAQQLRTISCRSSTRRPSKNLQTVKTPYTQNLFAISRNKNGANFLKFPEMKLPKKSISILQLFLP